MKKIDMVLSDLDGTFVHSGTLIQANMEAAQALLDAGIPFCICTGRAYTMMKSIIKGIGHVINPYMVTSNGASIYDLRGPTVIHSNYIPVNQLLKLLEVAKENGLAHNIFCGSELVCHKDYQPGWFNRNPARTLALPPDERTTWVVLDDWD
ncbi:MAG: Cof-type HAD-IIB family hydrolase, partial [Oscillospiraceae bacterium]|nr:Cof-type HAD-IIB family hydrolase [Oscillospiraceae bacterium]